MNDLLSLPQRILAAIAAQGPLDTRALRSQLEVKPANLGPAISRMTTKGLLAYSGPPAGMQRGGRYSLTKLGMELAGKPASDIAAAFKRGPKSKPSRPAPPAVVAPEFIAPRFAIDHEWNVAINADGQSVILKPAAALKLHQFLASMEPLLAQEEA